MFPTESSSAIQKGFFEKIRNFPPCDILQMCCLSRRSGELRFEYEGQCGLIHLEKGEVVHAQLGHSTAEVAAAEILSWPPGEFTFRDGVTPPQRTLKATWDQMLDASHHQQRATLAEEAPPPPGFESVGATDAAAAVGARIDPATQTGRLLIYGENIEGRTYDINLPVVHLGRAPTNEIILPDPSLSGRHCVFLLSNGRVTVRDLNSSNGTFVNGQPVTEAQLEVNDIIRAGTALIRFEIALKRPRLRTETLQLPSRPLPQVPHQMGPVAVTRQLPMPPPPSRADDDSGHQAPSMSGPISYARITRSQKTSRIAPKAPSWLIILVAASVLIVAYLIIGSQSWAPPWLRLW